ncbi:MAG: glycosyltransferase [Chitinophagaceae bacterium]
MAIKVLRIYSRINLGGPIYNVAYLSKYLAPEFETKILLGPALPDEATANHLLDKLELDYTIVEEMKRSVNPFQDLKSILKVRKIIKEFKPDIVHTHTAKAGAVGRLAAWSCGVRIIIHTFHGHVFHSYFSRPVSWAVKMFERFLASLSTVIVSISDVQKEEIGTIYKIAKLQKIQVIPLGLDLDKFAMNSINNRISFRSQYDLSDADTAMALIGRFAPVKNHGLLFDAIKWIKDQHPESFEKMVIFLVGDGDLKHSFQEKLNSYGIPFSEKSRTFAGGGVVFTSWITKVDEMMTGLDAVVLTSHNEGTPLSLIESQAAGVPVISTRVGGVENVVQNNKTGIIVPAGNIELLAQAMIRLIQNPEERKNMGAAAKDGAQSKYSFRRLVSDMRMLYKNELTQKGVAL